MDFEVTEGAYKSIKSLNWDNITEFVVVTGINGSGKTQLLELLNFHFGTDQQHKNSVNNNPANPFYGVKTISRNCSIRHQEVVYLPSIWQLGNLGATNASIFTEIINKLYSQVIGTQNHQNYQELATTIKLNINNNWNISLTLI